MAATCYDKELLRHSGTGQPQRLLKALLQGYACVDERTTADLILFAKNYGAYLNYYDFTDSVTGTWEDFMSADVAVTIAGVADLKAKDFSPYLRELLSQIQSWPNDAAAKQAFKSLFDFVFTLASQLDQSLRRLPAGEAFTAYFSVAVASNLALPLNLLTQYFHEFTVQYRLDFGHSLFNEASTATDAAMPLDKAVLSQNFNVNNLDPAWNITPPVEPPGITLTGTERADINRIVTHNLFTGPLQAFVSAVGNLVNRAPAFLEGVIKNYPSHAPHYALYLAFLRLFRFAQDGANGFTQNHLDFYYKDVLRLTNRAASPDFVHLVFELQKNNGAHLLTKGTKFKAGKDAAGNETFYALTDDAVVQKGSVEALKSIFLDKKGNPVLYASPVADSEDGQGAKLLSPDKSWYPFGDPKKVAAATVGFALASNLLYLNEGLRKIVIAFHCAAFSNLTPADLDEIFTVQVTGKKSWYTAGYTESTNGNTVTFTITLPGDAPPLVPYSKKIHGGDFSVPLPMVQMLLDDQTAYQKLKRLTVQSITLTVTANNVKDLSLQNDDGKINPAKPFKPFGEFPEPGAALVIGSKEIFQKPLTALTIHAAWQQPPAGNSGAAVALREGQWSSTAFASSLALGSSSLALSSPQNIPVAAADFSPNEEYKVTSVDGFIKLQLNDGSNSIASYLNRVKAAVAQTEATLQNDIPNKVMLTIDAPVIQLPPSPPLAKSVSIDYTASETISFAGTEENFTSRKAFFYHIEPFGFREMHPFLTADALSFLPVFDLDSLANPAPAATGGELWVGLKDALPGQTFSVLFQVAEGTADPLKPVTEVKWYYLSKNNWIRFEKLAVADQTGNLSRSGLAVLSVPDNATLGHTRAGAGLLWIKAVVDHDTEAVCKIIAVYANAAKAVFVQDPATGIAFTRSLPPATVSKPVAADAALKKIQQPHASFGGRIAEKTDAFYTRVSERLRHKHRALTAWDYERLVLQSYPQIHKAKCLRHTGFITNANTNAQKYSETLPGHVMVVTVPDLKNGAAANLLKPYTAVGLLAEIQDYLQKLTSPFVRLVVANPQFEEVRFEFGVSFLPDHDETLYSQLLNTAIERFLTPWGYEDGREIEFGGRIEKSVVLNFVEEQPYVDHVTCFQMHHIIKREGNTVLEAKTNVEEAIATTARSVLVSYYNEEAAEGRKRHLLSSPANCSCHD